MNKLTFIVIVAIIAGLGFLLYQCKEQSDQCKVKSEFGFAKIGHELDRQAEFLLMMGKEGKLTQDNLWDEMQNRLKAPGEAFAARIEEVSKGIASLVRVG